MTHHFFVTLRFSILFAGILSLRLCSAGDLRDQDAIHAIVGEAANQGYRGMLAVAGAIRNRGTLAGVYGLQNPMADKQPHRVWMQARAAWRESATNDITLGATHWENVRVFGKPTWANTMHVTVIVKEHLFFKR